MPSRPIAARTLRGWIAAVALAAIVVAPAATLAAPQAGGTHEPTMGYQPAFVSEREEGPWEDCIWASAAMFLDKWTSGAVMIDRERLRELSGDVEGGSGLTEVGRAFGKAGMPLAWSPWGGASVSWTALLHRLAAGGGAILLGDDGKLPERYGRWDPEFWSQTGTGDDHAIYLDRYDPRTDAIFVMDPLAPVGWTGEWVPASAVQGFAWKTDDGLVSAALTPPARVLAPLEGVSLGGANTSISAATLHVSWPIVEAARGWTVAGASVTADVTPLAGVDPALRAVQAPAATDARNAAQTAPPRWEFPGLQPPQPLSASGGSLTSSLPMPPPGLYRVTISITEDFSGRSIDALEPFALYVPGARAADLEAPGEVTIAPSGKIEIPVQVSNVGAETWAPPPPVAWRAPEAQRGPELRLVGTWFWQPSTMDGSTSAPYVHAPVRVDVSVMPRSLELEAGEMTTVSALLDAPDESGSWRLVLDLVDLRGWSLAAAGSKPAMIDVQVSANELPARPPLSR